jgi:dinuclear metal center YbgI/SA1388 family protein
MKIKEITSHLDTVIPLSFQASYDNSGLQVGDPEQDVAAAIISLEVTEDVVDEAIAAGCGLIVTHHPLIFTPLKKLTGNSHTERIVTKAIRHEIAIYSAHTNLDVLKDGVSGKMAEKLGLQDMRVLLPLKNRLLKLVTWIPEEYLESVREAVFNAGAGVIGGYDECSFSVTGTGSYRGGENTNPFAGDRGELHFEKEVRFETVIPTHLKNNVIKALTDAHPYEEVAYDIIALENSYDEAGLGCVGELPEAVDELEFIRSVSGIFDAQGVRYSAITGKQVKRVALCGGAGADLVEEAIKEKADAFVTSDLKYHDFFKGENQMVLVDIGHYESEKYSREILYALIIKKFPTFAVRFSETNTNPINYL